MTRCRNGPNFLLIGVQKAGTTALSRQLNAHPELFLPEQKELHFFDRESCDWQQPDYAAYEKNFSKCLDGCIAGEATPIYMYWPGALDRIRAYRPSMKLIILLRDPIERAYSHWVMERRRGAETKSFEEAIRLRLDRAEAVEGMTQGAHRVFSYVERSLYAPQLDAVFECFPRNQVHVTTHDHLRADYRSVLDSICTFLGVKRFTDYPPNTLMFLDKQKERNQPVSHDCHRSLIDLFRDDIRRTQQLTSLDISAWLSVDR